MLKRYTLMYMCIGDFESTKSLSRSVCSENHACNGNRNSAGVFTKTASVAGGIEHTAFSLLHESSFLSSNRMKSTLQPAVMISSSFLPSRW